MGDHRSGTRIVVSRQERADAFRAWKAVPFRRRTEVLRAAKRGERHPDDVAVTAALDFVRAVVADRGTRWYQRTSPRTTALVALAAGIFVSAIAVVGLVVLGPRDPVLWVFLALGVLFVLYSAYLWDFLRDARHLRALDRR